MAQEHLATSRAQDIAEVLNPDYHHMTEDEVNLFIKKQKVQDPYI